MANGCNRRKCSNVLRIEVSAELNLQAKSLKVYCEKYNPEIAVRVNLGE